MRREALPQVFAGQRDKQVTVLAATRAPDGGGGYTETTSEVATEWMAVEPLEGREQLEAMQTGMQRPHRFYSLYRSDITGATRLLYNGRTFDVKSVLDPEEKHRELVMLAEEII